MLKESVRQLEDKLDDMSINKFPDKPVNQENLIREIDFLNN